MDIAENRKRVTDWIRAQLVGPHPFMFDRDSAEDDDGTLRGINPVERFPCGAIYPVFEGEGEDPASTDDNAEALDDGVAADDGKEAEPVRRFVPPSSIGLSFYVTGTNIVLEATFYASRYTYDNSKNLWKRSKLEPAHIKLHAPAMDYHRDRVSVLNDTCAIADTLWRKNKDGWIVTVTLCNTLTIDGAQYKNGREFAETRAEQTLFEAKFELLVTSGEIGDYPRVDRSLLDDEEQEIELQYRNRKVYAIGHGTGVCWKEDADGIVRYLETDAMPTTEVPQTTADFESGEILHFRYLADAINDGAGIIAELNDFVNGYEAWIVKQENSVKEFSKEDRTVGFRITERMREANKRMRAGIELLGSDTNAMLAFSLANHAILDQMMQGDKQKGISHSERAYRWRPFQLAFLLAVLESSSNSESEYRDIVDLIWFPTGGGKTEAYFGLIAYVILLRRLRFPDTSGGTAALMRYTLRLLTKDQYLRATRLICALELMRQKRDDLGEAPISIGMWVGGEASPNHYDDAQKRVKESGNSGREPSFVIDKCPWCGQAFSISTGNYDVGKNHFHFRCKSDECEFGRNNAPIPCNIVDDHLYDNPPTLIVGTVDKFARMPWEKRVENFFGKDGNRPPELIIQDELHLISGALGSINGIYEAAIDSIIKLRGLYPKYIASTATIRTAENQIGKLYGREAVVFPPPGADCDDSYFAKTIPTSKEPGRLYIGYYAPMLNRQKCLAPLAAALLAAPVSLFVGDQDEDLLLDAWWTLVVYHGSLKGLANSQMSFDSDIRDRLRQIIVEIKEYYKPKSAKNKLSDREAAEADAHVAEGDFDPRVIELLEARLLPSTEELTSHKSARENAEVFSRLAIGYPEPGYIDAALATNMVSVGLDVARLALMIINGQPLTTAEYIQASSRVGRSDIPGIVFTNYYRDQTRSLSHYEQFGAYHDAFYRYVEPTSVTPFTWQARNRALHAALVSVMRHGIEGISEACEYSTDLPEVQRALAVLGKRCAQADPALGDEIRQHIKRLSGQWEAEAKQCAAIKRGFKYYANSNEAYDTLLYNYGDRIQGVWPTLQSMRNVEDTALLKES
jgi:hypothetical protein